MNIRILFAALAAFVVVGCNSEPGASPAEEKKLRDGFAKKNFDINEVPEKDRERVRAFMNANNGGAAASAPGASSAPK